MARYIDAEKAVLELQKFSFDTSNAYGCGYSDCLTAVEDVLNDLPTADVAEVKHGTWQKSQFSGRSGFYSVKDVFCSECKIYSTFLQHEIRPDYYCPNCGAKMDGGKEE